MRAPPEASSREIARPMPREPPVTTAVLMRASSGRDYIHGRPIAATVPAGIARVERSIHRTILDSMSPGPASR